MHFAYVSVSDLQSYRCNTHTLPFASQSDTVNVLCHAMCYWAFFISLAILKFIVWSGLVVASSENVDWSGSQTHNLL
jgi:hypothetical protein